VAALRTIRPGTPSEVARPCRGPRSISSPSARRMWSSTSSLPQRVSVCRPNGIVKNQPRRPRLRRDAGDHARRDRPAARSGWRGDRRRPLRHRARRPQAGSSRRVEPARPTRSPQRAPSAARETMLGALRSSCSPRRPLPRTREPGERLRLPSDDAGRPPAALAGCRGRRQRVLKQRNSLLARRPVPQTAPASATCPRSRVDEAPAIHGATLLSARLALTAELAPATSSMLLSGCRRRRAASIGSRSGRGLKSSPQRPGMPGRILPWPLAAARNQDIDRGDDDRRPAPRRLTLTLGELPPRAHAARRSGATRSPCASPATTLLRVSHRAVLASRVFANWNTGRRERLSDLVLRGPASRPSPAPSEADIPAPSAAHTSACFEGGWRRD